MTMPPVIGLTLTLRAGDAADAVAFYTDLLGRAPDYAPHDDFFEWELRPDAWLQLATGAAEVQPAAFRLRLQVGDLATAVAALRARGVDVEEPTTLPGVVAFTNFADPWGNPLGLFQDVAREDGPAVPGGSAADDALFVPGVVTTDDR